MPLFGIQPRDAASLAMGVTLMAAVSRAAGLPAARRAIRIDAMTTLRRE